MNFGFQAYFNSEYSTKILLFVLLGSAIGSTDLLGQTSDLARLEYTTIPQAKSENSISRVRAFVNYPIELDWEGSYLIVGLEYRNLDLDFEDPVPFNVDNLQRFQMFRSTLAYSFKMKKDWRFVSRVGLEINSNFENSEILANDVNFTGSLFLIKDRSGDDIAKPSRFIIGLNYSTNAGRPFPIPLLNYYRKFSPNWSYSLGTPKTNIKHVFSEKHTLQGFVTLDGFFSNIQNNLTIPNSDGEDLKAENMSMTLVLGGVGYEYYFTKHLLLYIYGGHTIFNEIRLRDRKRNNLYEVNSENTLYLRTGIKFKI